MTSEVTPDRAREEEVAGVEPGAPTDDGAPIESEGGMDGAGDYGLGLTWQSGVFVQQLWRGGEPSYLIINQGSADVDIFVDAVRGLAEGRYEPLAGPWVVPANAHREVSGTQLQVPEGLQLVSWRVGGSSLGLEFAIPTPPRATPAAVVSNLGVNGDGGESLGQIETDFMVAPGPVFSVTYVVPPGELTFSTHTDAIGGMPFFDVVAVRSDRGLVQTTATGFVVGVPFADGVSGLDTLYHAAPTDAEFARVEVDVSLPEGSSAAPAAVAHGFQCYEVNQDHQCASGYGMSRAIPLRE